jgi:hypothetical protein
MVFAACAQRAVETQQAGSNRSQSEFLMTPQLTWDHSGQDCDDIDSDDDDPDPAWDISESAQIIPLYIAQLDVVTFNYVDRLHLSVPTAKHQSQGPPPPMA